MLRRLRRASLAALRKEIEPTDQATLARFAVSWHGIDRYKRSGAKAEGERMPLDAAPDRLREVLAPLQGLALTPETWERDVLPAPPRQLRPHVARPAVRGRRGRVDGRRQRRRAAAAASRSTSARTRPSSGRRRS